MPREGAPAGPGREPRRPREVTPQAQGGSPTGPGKEPHRPREGAPQAWEGNPGRDWPRDPICTRNRTGGLRRQLFPDVAMRNLLVGVRAPSAVKNCAVLAQAQTRGPGVILAHAPSLSVVMPEPRSVSEPVVRGVRCSKPW